jgi:RNA polymerase sigma-70 factor (ECF subfamily)
MDDVDFADLMESARLGDEAAVAAVLGRFEPEIRTMVRVRLPKVLRSELDSMDIVQAVWTSVFAAKGDAITRFTDPGQFRGYLAGVARNKVFEEHRRRTRTKKYDLSREERLYVRKGERDIPREVAAPDPSASEEVQAGERYGQLIEGRTPEEIRILELRRQGLTFEEIAREIGTNERSVRRVIDAVRKRMEDREWR